jgi:tRNA-2-methylthio-N6-dimethylallyladenosine synthase
MIVGFQGETEGDFEATLSLVQEAAFDDAYTFRYSLRDGTPAVRLRDQVPGDVAQDRLERLIEAIRQQVKRKHVERVGTTHEVLVEQPAKRGGMLGRTRTNLLVLLGLGSDAVGQYHQVRLTGTTGSTFTGTLVATHALALL